MKNFSSGFNYLKWGFVIGTPLAIISAIATLLNIPAVGCTTGFNRAACESEPQNVAAVQVTEETIEAAPQTELPIAAPQPSLSEKTEGINEPINSIEPASLGLIEAAEGFSFQLNSCVQEEMNVVCEVLATDSEQSRKLGIYASHIGASSLIVDTSGNQYEADSVIFGGKETAFWTSQKMTQGVGVKAQFIFEDAQLQSDQLALFSVGANFPLDGPLKQLKYFSVPFRDVPLS